MKTPAIDKWIQRFLKQDPPRSKSLLMTVFGDAIAPRGGTVWLGSLMTLMAALDINDRLVRTSVFRLTEEGWLDANRSGRRSQYSLTAQGGKRFARAHQRIYAPVRTNWDGHWIWVIAPPALISTALRSALKKELLWEGFGMIAPGLFAHPGNKEAALTEILSRTGAGDKVFISSATSLEAVSGKPLTALLSLCWQLDTVRKAYTQFVKRFAPLQSLLSEENHLTQQQAFVIRTLLIHAFRRVQLHDPQLPAELLSTDWPGATAYDLCSSIYKMVCGQADAYVASTLEVEQDVVLPVHAAFSERFGGG
jgi:phenylacetic acid degradation operon negative regulatory protein